MTGWTTDELAQINGNDELQIASLRPDGALSSERTIWVVSVGHEVYVRSVDGPGSAWFRATRARHAGHVSIGDIDKDVTYTDAGDGDAGDGLNDQVDAAYQAKYRRYAASIVNSVFTTQARSTTLRLDPS